MSRGGARVGAGRKKQEYSTVNYHRRVKPEWVKILDLVIQRLKENRFNVSLTCDVGFRCGKDFSQCYDCVYAIFRIDS